MEWCYVWWPWLTSEGVARVCQHQLSFLVVLSTDRHTDKQKKWKYNQRQSWIIVLTDKGNNITSLLRKCSVTENVLWFPIGSGTLTGRWRHFPRLQNSWNTESAKCLQNNVTADPAFGLRSDHRISAVAKLQILQPFLRKTARGYYGPSPGEVHCYVLS